jgi:hypothetical protein
LPEIHGTTVLCVRKDDQVCGWREWICERLIRGGGVANWQGTPHALLSMLCA